MSKRYKLWHGQGTRSLRVLWTLEELGLRDEAEIVPVSFPPRLRQLDYLDVNPLGSLPYFQDPDVELSESMAACQYLAGKHAYIPLAVDPSERGYGRYLQFCFFGEATLMPPIGTLVVQLMMETPETRSDVAIQGARDLLKRRLEPLSKVLEAEQFLAAGRFTLADVSVGYALFLATLLQEQGLFSSKIAEYSQRLTERAAFRRANTL